jgi:Flp pilus assembly protein TadD
MSTLYDQAKVHLDRGEMDQAASALIHHLNGNFLDESALMMLGGVLVAKGQTGLAVAVTRQAIDIRKAKTGKPFPEALANLAGAFKTENRLHEAEQLWQIALEAEDLPHERAKLLSNLSTCHINEGRPQQAIEYLNQALALRPDLVGAQFNRGLANLEAGNWKQGWLDYETGFKSGERRTRTYRDIPEWDGTPDQTVIVWGEQGIGDEILFASCLPDMVKHSKKVILDCHPRLVATFKRSFPTVDVHGTRKIQGELEWLDDVEADGSICISSLPKFFRNCDQDFPGRPFLKRGPHAPLEGRRPKVGLAWAGGTKKTRNDLRSIPLEQWFRSSAPSIMPTSTRCNTRRPRRVKCARWRKRPAFASGTIRAGSSARITTRRLASSRRST